MVSATRFSSFVTPGAASRAGFIRRSPDDDPTGPDRGTDYAMSGRARAVSRANRRSARRIRDADDHRDCAEPGTSPSGRSTSELCATVLARYDTLFTQDGHRNGSIAIARELGLLGPFALLSHSVDLTPADFAALTGTGAHIVHNPSAIMSIYGRCPAPELIEKGVTVCLGSDAGAPDRGKEFRPGEIRRMGTRYDTQLRQWRRGSAARPGR